MAWEREHHHVNAAEGAHIVTLINRSITESDGSPARHILQIHAGAGEFEYKVGKNLVRIKLGGDFTIQDDGTLVDIEGNVFDPKAFEKELLAKLNHHHTRLEAYARKHNAPILKPGK